MRALSLIAIFAFLFLSCNVQAAGYVRLFGNINRDSMARVVREVETHLHKGERQIVLNLASEGGNLSEALRAFYYFQSLRAQGVTLTTEVSSSQYCESACTILFSAGGIRRAGHSSNFFFHMPNVLVDAGSSPVSSQRKVQIRYEYIQAWARAIGYADQALAQFLLQRDMGGRNGLNFTPHDFRRNGSTFINAN